MDREARARDTEQSDREWIAAQQRRHTITEHSSVHHAAYGWGTVVHHNENMGFAYVEFDNAPDVWVYTSTLTETRDFRGRRCSAYAGEHHRQRYCRSERDLAS